MLWFLQNPLNTFRESVSQRELGNVAKNQNPIPTMNPVIRSCYSALFALTLAAPATGIAKECFFIDNPVITSSPGNPLVGGGFGLFEGKFSDVVWSGSGLGSLSGTFSFQVGWNDVDPSGSFGIPWSVDPTLNAVVFDTAPGDSLLFGNQTLSLSGLPDGYELCETKFLSCIITEDPLTKELAEYAAKGYSLFYGYEKEKSYYTFDFSTSGDGRSYVNLDPTIKTTEGLSFYYSAGEGDTMTEASSGLQFDTAVKIGGCLCPVPEPSGAFSILAAGMAFTLRRRRPNSCLR